jgi:hypothetical protein
MSVSGTHPMFNDNPAVPSLSERTGHTMFQRVAFDLESLGLDWNLEHGLV